MWCQLWQTYSLLTQIHRSSGCNMVPAGWNTTTLPNRCSAISQLNISKSVDREARIARMASMFSWSYTLFFLWGYVKSMVYKTKQRDIADLRWRIPDVVRAITPQMLTLTWRHFYLWLGCCQDVQGTHFEHFLHSS